MSYLVALIYICAGSAIAQGPIAPAKTTSSYTVGAGDELNITLSGADELKDSFANPFVVDADGFLNVPLAGRIRSADLTPSQLQSAIQDRLKRFIRDPQVSINIRSIKSQTVSVLGAVNTPGVHTIIGPTTLAEVLASAGGLSKEAGYKVNITRERKWGTIPVPDAKPDPSGEFVTAELSTKELTQSNNPAQNILIKPNDVVTVPRSEVVYVIGEVHKPGGFTLGDRRQLTTLEALALAEGTTSTASQGGAKILRAKEGSSARTEMKIDLRKILKGKTSDVELAANDILVIPDNSRKRAGIKTAEMALQTISGIIIWRGF